MKHVVQHGLGEEKAKQATQAAINSYMERFAKYNPQANWVNDKRAEISFSAKGMTLKGALQVTAQNIEMDLDVPFLLKPFQGKAVGVIEGEIQKWVAKAKSGEI